MPRPRGSPLPPISPFCPHTTSMRPPLPALFLFFRVFLSPLRFFLLRVSLAHLRLLFSPCLLVLSSSLLCAYSFSLSPCPFFVFFFSVPPCLLFASSFSVSPCPFFAPPLCIYSLLLSFLPTSFRSPLRSFASLLPLPQPQSSLFLSSLLFFSSSCLHPFSSSSFTPFLLPRLLSVSISLSPCS